MKRARFPELFTDHVGYVERVLRSLGVAEAELPDVRQEVFLVVHRRLDSFEGRSSLRTWLYGICLRVVAAHRRGSRRRTERLAAGLPERCCAPPQLDAVLTRATAELVEATLSKLPRAQRDVFVLYELQMLPMDEVAARLGCPLKTGFTRLYAARRRVNAALRRALGAAAILEFAEPPAAALASAGVGAATPVAGAPAASALGATLLLAVAIGLSGGPIPRGATLALAREAPRPAAAPRYAVLPCASSDSEVMAPPRSVRAPRPQPSPPEPFEVQPLELPSLALAPQRIGLSEVVPTYAVGGQPPPPVPIRPAPIRTRLAPPLRDAAHLRAVLHRRRP